LPEGTHAQTVLTSRYITPGYDGNATNRWPSLAALTSVAPVTDLDLVPPTPELMAQVLEWRNRPDVTQWLMRTIVDPVRYTQAWLDSAADPLDHSSIVLVDGRAVATGSVEIRDGSGQFGHEPEFERCEGLLGYLVDPAYAGRGIATAVTTALLELAFGELGLRRVTAGCFADNTASWRVMEKAGMRREGHTVRDAWHANLGWVDGYTYAILTDEWRGTGPASQWTSK